MKTTFQDLNPDVLKIIQKKRPIIKTLSKKIKNQLGEELFIVLNNDYPHSFTYKENLAKPLVLYANYQKAVDEFISIVLNKIRVLASYQLGDEDLKNIRKIINEFKNQPQTLSSLDEFIVSLGDYFEYLSIIKLKYGVKVTVNGSDDNVIFRKIQKIIR